MKKSARRETILDHIRAHGASSIEDLAGVTGVSTSTIRRDVDELQEVGEVLALRGGAVQLNSRMSELPVAAKSSHNRSQKEAIARAAATFVVDGDTIYLDSGTTCLQMLEELAGKSVRVVTSNTAALSLVPPEGVEISVLPGDYIPDLASICGAWTDNHLRHLFLDKAFIGANGLSDKGGITTFDVREAVKKRIAHEQSGETFVLVDSSKFGKTAFCRALPMDECTVITDRFDSVLKQAKSYAVAD